MAGQSGFEPCRSRPGPVPVNLADVFAVFADPARLRLLELLIAGARSLPECVDALGAAAPSTTAHLRYLAERGLVSAPRGGDERFRICEPRVRVVVALARSLTEDNAPALRSCPFIPGVNR